MRNAFSSEKLGRLQNTLITIHPIHMLISGWVFCNAAENYPPNVAPPKDRVACKQASDPNAISVKLYDMLAAEHNDFVDYSSDILCYKWQLFDRKSGNINNTSIICRREVKACVMYNQCRSFRQRASSPTYKVDSPTSNVSSPTLACQFANV